jgi:hypothetical protein
VFERLKRLITNRSPRRVEETPPEVLIDPDWSLTMVSGVLSDVRREAEELCARITPLVGVEPVFLEFDPVRGSLRLNVEGLPSLAVATSDATSAQELAAAFRLGGLRVSLRRTEVGILEIFGCWEGRWYQVRGIPAERVVRQ